MLVLVEVYLLVYLHVSNLSITLMSNVLGVYHGTRLYIAGYTKQRFIAFRRFSILAMFGCFATLHKPLSVWAKALKA